MQVAIAVGDLKNGYWFAGPFENEDAAIAWVKSETNWRDYSVVGLHPPTKSRPFAGQGDWTP